MIKTMIKRMLLKVIRFYQKFISPYTGRNCRFYPSCSEYSFRAIKKYGVFKGMTLSILRILRCNPYSKGGIDLP
jgi:hypothetical protein